jgi:hypothetical protein
MGTVGQDESWSGENPKTGIVPVSADQIPLPAQPKFRDKPVGVALIIREGHPNKRHTIHRRKTTPLACGFPTPPTRTLKDPNDEAGTPDRTVQSDLFPTSPADWDILKSVTYLYRMEVCIPKWRIG